jgi:uncharacterized iron-regulated protein
MAQKEAYVIFNNKGKEVPYSKLLKEAKKADVILFGEFHDNPIIHWLQLELTNDLYMIDSNLVLGAEMFESDDQIIINEYLFGYYSETKFEAEAKLWPNYSTDYKPLLNFAKENKLAFIGTNVPRRYASMVYHLGIDTLISLSEEAQNHFAPLPIAVDTSLSSYSELLQMMDSHGGINLVYSQALKDATMAYFILNNFSYENQFIHFNGAYHSKDYEGIYWYLSSMDPDLNILTIGCEEQDLLSELDKDHSKANFIIVTPSSMTKTY